MIKYLIIISLMLLPCLTFAETKCKVSEYPDHNEVDCSGEEAASKSSAQKTVPSQQLPTAAQADFNQKDESNPAPSDPAEKAKAPSEAGVTSSPTPSIPQPAQPASNQNINVIKHGRQQYQQSLEDAKAARKQLILEKQQSQPATPVPSTTPN